MKIGRSFFGPVQCISRHEELAAASVVKRPLGLSHQGDLAASDEAASALRQPLGLSHQGDVAASSEAARALRQPLGTPVVRRPSGLPVCGSVNIWLRRPLRDFWVSSMLGQSMDLYLWLWCSRHTHCRRQAGKWWQPGRSICSISVATQGLLVAYIRFFISFIYLFLNIQQYPFLFFILKLYLISSFKHLIPPPHVPHILECIYSILVINEIEQ